MIQSTLPINRFNHPTQKLGKRAPRIDVRTLALADYLPKKKSQLMIPPKRAGYVKKVAPLGMMLNDKLGCCAVAAPGHMIQQWTAYSGSQVIVPDDAILKAYEDVGGYVPGDPSTDNGCVMLDVLRYWRKTGIGGHKIGAFVSVDYTNRTEMELAAWLFGNVYVGVQLPLSAQNTSNPFGSTPLWSVPRGGANGDGSPGSWGGHAIPIVGYSNDLAGNPGTQVITWGAVYDMTWAFIWEYMDEAWAVLSLDWIEKSGKAPSGFKIDDLKSDLLTIDYGKGGK